MSAEIDAINAAKLEVIAAIAAGDYATAIRKADVAAFLISFIPDTELENELLKWDRPSILATLEMLQKRANQQAIAASTAGGIFQSTDILYKRDC